MAEQSGLLWSGWYWPWCSMASLVVKRAVALLLFPVVVVVVACSLISLTPPRCTFWRWRRDERGPDARGPSGGGGDGGVEPPDRRPLRLPRPHRLAQTRSAGACPYSTTTGNYQLSTINHQPSTINHQLIIISLFPSKYALNLPVDERLNQFQFLQIEK